MNFQTNKIDCDSDVVILMENNMFQESNVQREKRWDDLLIPHRYGFRKGFKQKRLDQIENIEFILTNLGDKNCEFVSLFDYDKHYYEYFTFEEASNVLERMSKRYWNSMVGWEIRAFHIKKLSNPMKGHYYSDRWNVIVCKKEYKSTGFFVLDFDEKKLCF